MSSSAGQPPLTRRQVRDLERAREAGRAVTGAVPVSSEPTSSAPQAPASVTSAPSPLSVPSPVPGLSPATAADAPAAPVRAASEPNDASATGLSPASVPAPASAPGRASAPSPASTPAPASAVGPEQGLTRRQLRALRDAEAGKGAGPVPLQAPGPEPRRPLSEALTTVDEIIAPLGAASTGPSAPAASREPSASAPAPTSAPGVFPLSLDDRAATSSAGTAPSAPVSPLRPASFERRDDASTAAPVAPASAVPAPAAAPVAPARASQTTVPASAPESNGFVPPVGHWTTQSTEPDGETAPGRALGTHTGQTNALILTDQQVADVTGALNATGEIIITGSIDLPRSLGATGSQARVDSADIDRLLEQGDAENAETDAVPVRASRAISTHTSTRAVVLAASQPKSSRLPLYLGIGGGIIGAGIIGVVVAGFATGILGQ